MPTPNEIVNIITARAEEVSGTPVLVNPDPSLQLYATVKMARGGAPAHVISYNPRSAAPDYAVAFQCGYIIRTFSVNENNRLDVGGSYWGRKEANKLVTEHLRRTSGSVSKEVREQVAVQIYDGLVRQLRSMPVGLRVDGWLASEYPDLHEQQRVMIARQLNDNLGTLRPEVKKMAPDKVYSANVGMNAAFASFWARKWNEPEHVVGYKAAGFLDLGEKLLNMYDEVPDHPGHDRQLIESWGEATGINGWYEFVPFRT
jgi:hypothetical protein